MAISRVVGGTPPHPGIEGPAELLASRKPATLVRLGTLGWDDTPESSRAAFDAAVTQLAHAGVRILDATNDAETAALEAALRTAGDYGTDIFA